MFDFMRDRGDGGRQQEAIDAYLDNALTPADRARFEAQMAADARLRAEVEQLRALRWQLRAMPRRRVPRSFALNPAAYSRPKAQPLFQLYPVLRGATALSAFLLIFVLALGAFGGQFGGAPQVAGVPAAVEEAAQVADVGVEQTESIAIEEEAPAAELAAPASEEASRSADETATAAPAEAAAMIVEGTPAPAPEGDLVLESESMAAEATMPANAGGGIEAPAEEQSAAEPTAPVAATLDAVAQDTAEFEATPAEEAPRSLLPLQIGLGVLFVALLALWLLARRRVRSL